MANDSLSSMVRSPTLAAVLAAALSTAIGCRAPLLQMEPDLVERPPPDFNREADAVSAAIRRGDWPEVVALSARAAHLAAARPFRGGASLHFVRAVDHLVYGLLQQGHLRQADEVIAWAERQESHQPHPVSAASLVAVHARRALELQDWSLAATLEPAQLETDLRFPDYPEALALGVYARGLGAARDGRLDDARHARARLERLIASARQQRATKARELARLEIQGDVLEVWITWLEGRPEEAELRMREAVGRSDWVNVDLVQPPPLLEPRELLGDLLLALGRPAEALEVYEASLVLAPRRAYALAGAGRAAAAVGDHATAARRYRELLAQGIPEGAGPLFEEARRFVFEEELATRPDAAGSQGGAEPPR